MLCNSATLKSRQTIKTAVYGHDEQKDKKKGWVKMKEKFFSLRTRQGCRRLFACLLVFILVCSFFAALIASDFGRVKHSRVTIDARGAVFEGDLYIPAGTSDEDSLPAVSIAHGRGVGRGTFKSFAEELARRGFVVLNVDAYGVGLSEQPVNDESGLGASTPGGSLDYNSGPMGALDATNYLRSLEYVDETRVAIIGQSGGGRRAGVAAIEDCGYYSFNDIMINVLYNDFDIKFAADEIYQDADEVAKAKLNEDQLSLYNYIRDEKYAEFDSRLKAVCLLGSAADKVFLQSTVQVAGHDVVRNCQTSICIVNGSNDTSYRDLPTRDSTKQAMYLGDANMEKWTWYLVDDEAQTSTALGSFAEASVADDPAFYETINTGITRMYVESPNESHSKGFFSVQTTANVVHYLEQRLNYNCGNLTDTNTIPLDPGKSQFVFREILNGLCLLAMFALIFPTAALVLNRNNAEFVPADSSALTYKYDKKQYWGLSLVSIALTFYAIYKGNLANGGPMAPRYSLTLFPLISTYRNVEVFILYVAIASVIMLALFAILSKKATGETGLKRLGLAIPVKKILGYFGIALAVLGVSYLTLMVIEYLFNQDFRFWMAVFTEMKAEDWGYAFTLFVILTPLYVAINSAINFSTRTDIPQLKDDIICVVLNSAGVWLCGLIQIIFLFTVQDNFSSFICSYQVLLVVPLTVIVARLTYRMTNSIWLGAFVNAMFIAWSMVSSTGASDFYFPIGFFGRVLGV